MACQDLLFGTLSAGGMSENEGERGRHAHQIGRKPHFLIESPFSSPPSFLSSLCPFYQFYFEMKSATLILATDTCAAILPDGIGISGIL